MDGTAEQQANGHASAMEGSTSESSMDQSALNGSSDSTTPSNGSDTLPTSGSDASSPPSGRLETEQLDADSQERTGRKRVVVVGLGMVGIAFIEKLLKLDAKRREYDVIVIGEEPHLAYNRVGLTSFFQHREVEQLYLNPASWYSEVPQGSLNYHLNTRVTSIDTEKKTVDTSIGSVVSYDILVLATGSDAMLPRHTPGHDAKGVFVYRTIDDLQRLIAFAKTKEGSVGTVVGGGLLGLEAAKAMMDLEHFSKVKLVERNSWVLSRQLDGDAGGMVVEQVRNLGLDVLLRHRVQRINTDEDGGVAGVTFENGESIECTCVCFAIGIKARKLSSWAPNLPAISKVNSSWGYPGTVSKSGHVCGDADVYLACRRRAGQTLVNQMFRVGQRSHRRQQPRNICKRRLRYR